MPSRTLTPFSSMPRADRVTFDTAITAEKRGDVRGAWDTAQPLFDSYPTVIEVQELRCRLARERGFMAGVVEAYCERFENLQKER
jgi:hypothetical protein